MASAPPFDPFRALGIPRDASTATIKSRYHELARKYHPNRHQGSEESKAALSEQFQSVHQAWKCIVEPEKRRRYIELLRLAEEQDVLLARMADLLTVNEPNSVLSSQAPHHDGHVSSDADEDDLPYVGPARRRTTLERVTAGLKHLGDVPERAESPSRVGLLQRRVESHDSAIQVPTLSTIDTGGQEGDYFTLRRKKLEKLRRKEMAAFERYKTVMVDKFEAELEAERQRDAYDRAKWKREYFERAPRETSERLRAFGHFMSAYRAFGKQAPRRRNRSTVSYSGQILSTDDILNGQYLAPDIATSPSRNKSPHRRGWSSDISGDQTSSDECSSGGHASPKPGSSWTWQRRHSRNTSLDAFQASSLLRTNGSSKPSLPEHAPFKMVVKRPTGFVDHLDEQDSSPESALTLSRPSSPLPCNQVQNTFTIPLTRRLSDILSRPKSLNGNSSNTERVEKRNSDVHPIAEPVLEPCHFMIKHVGGAQFSHVPMEHVHELNPFEKSWMLLEADADADPIDLLKRLSILDRNVADKFLVKLDIKEAFNFRLIYSHREVVKAQHQSSFIALSYRRKLHVDKKHGYFTLPLDAEMYQAVWDERLSDTEGVWIDQICIEQDSRIETTVSMSAMDMVYRSARLVVVALDDIELEAHEGTILDNHMDEYARMLHVAPTKRFRGKQPPYLDTHEELYQVLRKLLRSSWFKRAWCRHEMRLARDHVFLIPCRSAGPRTGKNVVRFTGNCLTHLLALATEVPFEPDIEMVKPALAAFFRDRSRLAPQERHMHSHHGNFTTVVAEVFGMEAGGDPRIPAKQRAADAMKDKISIILNTMECGLALTPEMRDPAMPLTKSECHYMLIVLALAAQDPGALCSVGPPMRLVQADNLSPLSPSASSTWLFEPTNVDSGLNNYRTLHRLPASSKIETGLEAGEHFVQLDLKFLRPGTVRHAQDDPESLELANRFINVCTQRKFGRNRQRYLISDAASNRHFGSMRDVYVQTLACVFECGPDWVEDVCHRYGVSRWKQDGESAWNLLVALRNTNNRWPESAWSGQAAGYIMDFVNFLVIRGMPQRQILHREEWRPIWIATSTGGKVLTFVPPGNIFPAVPTALLDEDYVHLARLWVLSPRVTFADPNGQDEAATTRWTLLGKSVLFSDDLAIQQLHSRSGAWREEQRVFGREDPEIQRLLRERSLYF
ncbi:hypothetical protein LTR36_002127 [Oleoguttula mirabilis]|uniref:J domain-containing protein n=1 Tax=Oleoguttula mirabilis TaxID=1507867 RepID=A0AAV9JM69_9PEZI|nr:hypothetical protein LTR36_002127 [Oleoguttula mirabilis]